jgi:protein tyrosine phosphatase
MIFAYFRCHSYFPTKDSQGTKRFGIYILELVEEKTDGYTVRKLKLTPKKGASTEPRIIHHFQFTNWPDFGVPGNNEKFLSSHFVKHC